MFFLGVSLVYKILFKNSTLRSCSTANSRDKKLENQFQLIEFCRPKREDFNNALSCAGHCFFLFATDRVCEPVRFQYVSLFNSPKGSGSDF